MSDTMNTIEKLLFSGDPEIENRIRMDTERFRKGFGELTIADTDGKPLKKGRIHFKLRRHEFQFGCNGFMYGEFPEPEQNQRYAEEFKKLFNTAVIPFYWKDLEPEDGNLRFGAYSRKIYRRPAPDQLLSYCEENGIRAKGHPLMWYAFYPEWVAKDPQLQLERWEQRFAEIAARYGRRIHNWDVINEVLSWAPGHPVMMPENHVEAVFRLAEKYFPKGTVLNYNEQPCPSWSRNHLEYSPLPLMVENLRRNGCKVDCTGLQYHIFEPDPDVLIHEHNWGYFFNEHHILRIMDNFAKIRMPVNISEITIPVFRADGVDGEEMQARIAERLYRFWFSHPVNTGIIWWNFVDGTASYGKLGSNEGENRSCGGLLKADFSPKKVYHVIDDLIHREWTTDAVMDYEEGAVNKIHGFYGDYDVEVDTDHGTFQTSLALYSKAFKNLIHLELKKI